jgi:hypothetical protein
MRFSRLAHLIFLLSLTLPSNGNQFLTATAVVSDSNDNARIECWEFTAPFAEYPTVGMALALANVSNLTYVVLPPRSKEGLHKPPHIMFFVLLSGLAHVTLPDGSDEVWIMEGVNGLIVAADTTGIGHYTEYPSDKETVALQIPFADGKVPAHDVLKEGACHSTSQVISDHRITSLAVEEEL